MSGVEAVFFAVMDCSASGVLTARWLTVTVKRFGQLSSVRTKIIYRKPILSETGFSAKA